MTDPNILILDDDDYTLHLLSRVLSDCGYSKVHQANHAHQALARMADRSSAPDIVICDLNLPGMDGVEFLEALALSTWEGGLVLITGESERLLDAARRLATSLHLNVLGTLIKPVERARIAALLERYTPRLEHPPDRAETGRAYSAEEIKHAIERDEFILHYQPIVRLGDGAASSLECLVRWRHPDDGLIYPERFIARAEEYGLIHALTGRVIEHAAAQLGNWRNQGLTLPLSINLSMHTLQLEGIVEWLHQKIAAAGVRNCDIVWEVTESRAMTSVQRTLSALSRLRLRRFSLAIDDFGTGHSSLAQLRDLPFAELKIDRSFTHDAHRDPVRAAIVEGSVRMASHLGMSCVAEGVETLEDWAFVQQSGCTHAQGWAIARAQPAASISAWLARWPEEFRDLQSRSGMETIS